MKLILAEPFKTLWAGLDAFAEVEKLQGQVFRELAARRTLRTEVAGQPLALQGEHGFEASKIIRQVGVSRFQIPTRHQIASP